MVRVLAEVECDNVKVIIVIEWQWVKWVEVVVIKYEQEKVDVELKGLVVVDGLCVGNFWLQQCW